MTLRVFVKVWDTKLSCSRVSMVNAWNTGLRRVTGNQGSWEVTKARDPCVDTGVQQAVFLGETSYHRPHQQHAMRTAVEENGSRY